MPKIHKKISFEHSIELISCSPNGKFILLVLDSEFIVRVWEIESFTEIKNFEGHTDYLLDVSYSPNGKFVASGGFDRTVRVWSIERGTQVSLFSPNGVVLSVCFSPNEKFVASAGDYRGIKVWDLETNREILCFGESDMLSISYSPSGKFIASVCEYDDFIRVWDIESGEEIKQIVVEHEDIITFVRYSTNGKLVASGSDDDTIRVWNIESNKEVRCFVNNEPYISYLDGDYLATGGYESLTFWNMRRFKMKEKTIEDK